MRKIYNIERGVCGVYKITNNITGDFYIGSSNDVSSRLSNHMVREPKLYPHKKFYQDVVKYGRDNFSFELLERCTKETKIEREQYWYDNLHPTYNEVRPTECNFIYKGVMDKAHKNSNDEEHIKRRKELYNTPKYQHIWRYEANAYKMKWIECIKDEKVIKTFFGLSECQRWIEETTSYKAKSGASKIKECCDGIRRTVYGYKWRYKESQETNCKPTIDTLVEAESKVV